MWKVSLDGSAVELLNGELGEYVDAIEAIGGPPRPPLGSGDANNDGSVDTADIVQILAANKFETGQPATFAEGDFDFDGVFATSDIVVMLAAGLFETGRYRRALKDPMKGEGTDQVVVSYDFFDGNLSVIASEPITSVSVESASGIFTGSPAANLGGPFDVDTDVKVFKAVFGSDFSEVDFGAVAQPRLGRDFFINDLTVSGSLAAGGTFGPDVQYGTLTHPPEPSTLVLLALGGVGLALHRRRISRSLGKC